MELTQQMLDAIVDERASYFGAAISSLKLTSIGPTRGGDQIQARFRCKFGNKRTIRCFSLPVSHLREHPKNVPFGYFIESLFDIQKSIHSMPHIDWKESSLLASKVTDRLIARKFHTSSQKMREKVYADMRSASSLGSAQKKKNQAEILRSRKFLGTWFSHAFKHGMEEEEMVTLMKESLVKSVLSS